MQGAAQGDAIRNITAEFMTVDLARSDQQAAVSGTIKVTQVWNNGVFGAGSYQSLTEYWLKFNASNVVHIAAENRPRNIVHLWCIKAL